MKYVKFLMALLAACMFVVPAFSMPNFGDNAKDGKALIDAPCQSQASPEDPHGPQPCDCKEKMAPKSMMVGKCDKPMMGPEGDKFGPKSMMDDKAPCEKAPKMDDKQKKPMMDEQAPKMDDKAPCEKAPKMDEKAPCGPAPKSMMDGKFAPQDGKAPCQKHHNGQDNKSVPAPMMDGKEPNDLPLPGQ